MDSCNFHLTVVMFFQCNVQKFCACLLLGTLHIPEQSDSAFEKQLWMFWKSLDKTGMEWKGESVKLTKLQEFGL